MSEKKYYHQWNAVTYMRDFINTALPLNTAEEKNLETACKMHKETVNQGASGEWRTLPSGAGVAGATPAPAPDVKKKLKAEGKKRCKICGQIKPQVDFYHHCGVCKKCTNERRRDERNSSKK